MTSHAAIRTALADNGLAGVPDDLVDAMVTHAQRMKNSAARARRKRHPKYGPAERPKNPHGWNAEDRAAARSHACALLSYAGRKPRNPETPRARRQQLLALLDRLSVMLMLKATRPVRGGPLLDYDVTPLLEGLRRGRPRRDQLQGLVTAIDALPAPARSGRPPAPYMPLIRAGATAWLHSGKGKITPSLSQLSSGHARLEGPFPALLRALFQTLDVNWPGDEAVHQQLLKL